MGMTETGHEVMVCNYGNRWKLTLRRSDAGLLGLPTVSTEEAKAVRGAHDFIESRRASARYAHEAWFCLKALQGPKNLRSPVRREAPTRWEKMNDQSKAN
jgi:hypothetical protein